jgi:hypothetical protein
MNAWSKYESPSNALTSHVTKFVSDLLPGTPEWALFLRWYTNRRTILVQSCSGSTLAVVGVDAGTVRMSDRLSDEQSGGRTLPLDFTGDPCWTPEEAAATA